MFWLKRRRKDLIRRNGTVTIKKDVRCWVWARGCTVGEQKEKERAVPRHAAG